KWMAGRTTDASGKTVVAAAGSAASRMIPGRSRDTERASRRDGPDAGGIRRRLQGGTGPGGEATRALNGKRAASVREAGGTNGAGTGPVGSTASRRPNQTCACFQRFPARLLL